MKAASVYTRLGWRVLPVRAGGKIPLLADWPNQASRDPAVVARWQDEYPTSNIGIACGAGSRFFTLDVDPRHGGDAALAALEAEHGPLPLTTHARTPSGGSHFLFSLPDFSVTNSASRVGPGLDIRGDGGQIVVAPSVTPAGQYCWINAPWDVTPAPAPAWLLERLGRVQNADTAAPVSADQRGYFPPASPAVLDQARETLVRHGPAVDGQGGGLHAVHAAAILTHDFALTEEEAWPLFLEWNETNDPPWDDLEDLRVRLQRGRKYGKLEFGCRRTLDARHIAKRMLTEWKDAGGDNDALQPVLIRIRAIRVGDPLIWALIERDVMEFTGMKPRAIALPKSNIAHDAVPTKPGEIRVTHKLHDVADEATRAIAPYVFVRNGVLCQVVKQERTFIHDLESAGIQDIMSRSANYVRPDSGDLIETAAPGPIATILQARRTHEGIRVLEAVTTAPVFLADGSILQERGYNEQARVFLEPSVTVDVPDQPDRTAARAAVRVFLDLLSDFHFATRADFSSWLAALLSPLTKAATKNAPVPLICISANSAGAGKSLLADTLALIVTGDHAENRPYNPRDPAEWGKRLTAFVKAASPVSVFDNANGAIGDEGIDRLITSSTWSDRLLGASEAPPMPNVTTWLATGNNIEPIGDTVRRVLLVRTEVDVERPDQRTGFKIADLAGYALEHRSALLSAALTILRAFHVAGRPDMQLASWGSFTTWSALVRGALVWTGLPDPWLTQQRASIELNEPENEAHDWWISVVEASDGTPAGISTLANQRDVRSALGCREDMTPVYLRRFLGRFIDKPRAGKRIRRDGGSYLVELIASAAG